MHSQVWIGGVEQTTANHAARLSECNVQCCSHSTHCCDLTCEATEASETAYTKPRPRTGLDMCQTTSPYTTCCSDSLILGAHNHMSLQAVCTECRLHVHSTCLATGAPWL